jgi:choline dehydrogenase-like flavoprotein
MEYEVIVAGAGIGGICAAIAAARQGARTLLVETGAEIGGTGVHSPLGLICQFWDRAGQPISRGLHREFFPVAYDRSVVPGTVLSYDHRELQAKYRAALAAEPQLTVVTGTPVLAVEREGRQITAVQLGGTTARRCTAAVFIDATADGNLAALAGCGFDLGRAEDGRLQPATLTFLVDGIDIAHFAPEGGGLRRWDQIHRVMSELNPYYLAAKAAGELDCPREDVLCFPYPDGRRILFNQTRMLGIDPTDPASVARGEAQGRAQIERFITAIRQHPAFAQAFVTEIASRLGVREGRRIHGDHTLTAEECLAECRFPDMVSACAYPVDIHSPTGAGTRIEHIPGSGYYHIPYRCLIARDADNLLLGSRCISGTHEAHASYRVMSSIAPIGEAAGVAAALAAAGRQGVRAIPASTIRAVLAANGQFVEEVPAVAAAARTP